MNSTSINSQQAERLLKLPDVIGNRKKGIVGLIPMSKSKFYQNVKAGSFPPPLRIGAGSFWRLSDIQKIIEKAAA